MEEKDERDTEPETDKTDGADSAGGERQPAVSVVVPVYNAEAFLERTVEAIEGQTLRDIEILLVNDGSTDGSLSVCRKLAGEDGRIRVFDKENGGASSARNVGVAHAHGRYIGFVDADDLIYPDMYENLTDGAATLEKMKIGNFIVQIGREEINEAGDRLPDVVIPPAKDEFESARDFAESLLLYTGDASFCTSLLPAAFMKSYRFPEGTTGEDFRLLMEMTDRMEGVLRLPMRGYRVIHRAGSVTRKANPSKFSRVYVDIVEHADWCEKELVRRFPDLQIAALRFGLYERLDYMLHVPIPDMHRDNAFYMSVCGYLKKNFGRMLKNPYLTAKNKLYLTLFTVAPRLTRKVHWKIRGKKILAEEKILA